MYLLLTVYSMRRHTSKMHYKEDDLVGAASTIEQYYSTVLQYSRDSTLRQNTQIY